MLKILSSRRSCEDDDLSRVCMGEEEDGDGGEKVAAMANCEDAIHLPTEAEAEANRHVRLGGADLTIPKISYSFCSSGPDDCETKNNNHSCKSSKLDVFQDASNTPPSVEVEDKEEDSGMEQEEQSTYKRNEYASSKSTLESGKGSFHFNNVLGIFRSKSNDNSSMKSEDSSTQSQKNIPSRNFIPTWRRKTITHSNSNPLIPTEMEDADDDTITTLSRSNTTDRFQGFDFLNRLRFRRKLERQQLGPDTDDIEEKQEPIDTTTTTNRDVEEGGEEEKLSLISPTSSFSPTQFISSDDYKVLDGSFKGLLAEALKGENAIDIVMGSLSHPVFMNDVEHLWGNESHIWKSEAHHQLEAWCKPCGSRPPLMLSSIRRCLRGRRKLGWPKGIKARSIVDTLVTRTFQLLPTRDMHGRHILVTTLSSLDYERCPHEQYDKYLSYLLQDAANIRSGIRRNIYTLGTFPSCNELVLAIDIKDLTSPWAKIRSLLDNVLGIKNKQDGRKCTITQWTTSEGHPLCDSVLSYFPLVLSSVVVVNVGTMAKATLAARQRVFHNSNYHVIYAPSKGGRNSGKLKNNTSTRKQSGHSKEGIEPFQLPITIVSSTDDWTEMIGDEGFQALSACLGGNIQTSSIDIELNHRIRMEDLPQDSMFRSDMEQFLQIVFELSHVSSSESYVNCLTRALQQMSITVPVMWVRQSLGDLEEASTAESAAWQGRYGKGVREDLVQLQKDVARDEIFIDGVPATTGDVIDALYCRIKVVAAEGGLKIADVQQHLAARDILLSLKRTTAGGDIWACIDTLCRNRNLVVICPISEDADGLQISVEFVPGTPDVNTDSSLGLVEEDRRPLSWQVGVDYEMEGSKSLKFLSDRRYSLTMSHDPTQKLYEEMLKHQVKKGIDMTGGSINVTARTKMIFKICVANPLDGCSLLTISCTYFRYFSVDPEGLVDGTQPSNLSPLVIISCDLNNPSPTNGVPE